MVVLEMGNLCNIFSTEMWQFDNDDMDQFHPNIRTSSVNNEDLKQMILEKEKTEVSETLSNSGGWHSGGALQNDKRFSALSDFIALGMKQIISHNNDRDVDNVDIVISNAWANVNRYRDFNEIHQHPGVHWAGVYYVDGPENSGTIRFFDPRVVRQMIMPDELLLQGRQHSQNLQYALAPRTGGMLIFPSWLQHAVRPNETKNPRISISFNIVLTPRIDQGLKPHYP